MATIVPQYAYDVAVPESCRAAGRTPKSINKLNNNGWGFVKSCNPILYYMAAGRQAGMQNETT